MYPPSRASQKGICRQDRILSSRRKPSGRTGKGSGLVGMFDKLKQVCLALLEATDPGEIEMRAVEALMLYGRAEGRQREWFFQYLASDLGVEVPYLQRAIAQHRKQPTVGSESALFEAMQSRRLRLLHLLNSAPEAPELLVSMRSDLLSAAIPKISREIVDLDFRRFLVGWFDLAFLRMDRLDWSSPAAMLENVVEFEAVHGIKDWGDLRRRLDNDRRCFALFHPALKEVPLIFVEIALSQGVPGSIQELLDMPTNDSGTGSYDTAVFYSITRTRPGLRGIRLGGVLLKRVIKDSAVHMPGVQNFVTLSPLPGFLRWFKHAAVGLDWIGDDERRRLAALDDPSWVDYPEVVKVLKPVLVRAAREYLSSVDDVGERVDSVARFHLSNGATVERLNWMADVSPKGLTQSGGLMVNYRYVGRQESADTPQATEPAQGSATLPST